MNIPVVSVIMPVYNCELYVKEAIESILNQSYTDFELLIIDDASTDTTVEIIQEFADERIVFIQKPKNSGYTHSLNYGLQIAKGNYIARMDGDDRSVAHRFEKQVTFLENNDNVVLCGGWFQIIDSDKIIKLPEYHVAIKLHFLRGNCIAHPSVMIRKSALDEQNIVYDSTKEPAEDYDLWSRLAFVGELHNLQEVLLEYRVHIHQVSSQRAALQKKHDSTIKRNLYQKLDYTFTEEEHTVFDKLLDNGEGIVYQDYTVFKRVQSKLLKSNKDQLFEPKGFQKEILFLDKIFVKSCFLKKKQFKLSTYLDYCTIKKALQYQLDYKDEFKLALKSLIYFKS